ncbi:hypothetical protein BC937DRAFT_91799 [Endogone sp. FLAS-F59071]|nr:hypothetical protein BC937DRAFT_91799 [Endogone sp. FLAS-F59071]|eukprot:RUS15925.1 hypothetical protein BC937DRAFT_91799 [Endogone sp. FLAS-F59071]
MHFHSFVIVFLAVVLAVSANIVTLCGNGTSCSSGYCCSNTGFCGQDDSHCGATCNPQFGICGSVITSGSMTSVSATAGQTNTMTTVLTTSPSSSATPSNHNSTTNNVPRAMGDTGNAAIAALAVTVLVAVMLL